MKTDSAKIVEDYQRNPDIFKESNYNVSRQRVSQVLLKAGIKRVTFNYRNISKFKNELNEVMLYMHSVEELSVIYKVSPFKIRKVLKDMKLDTPYKLISKERNKLVKSISKKASAGKGSVLKLTDENRTLSNQVYKYIKDNKLPIKTGWDRSIDRSKRYENIEAALKEHKKWKEIAIIISAIENHEVSSTSLYTWWWQRINKLDSGKGLDNLSC